ncbi:cryptochrome/photolyase family protein [Adhaeribacter pallidiroseus]|uniref:Deoxyribodipyrimidine photo-lyase n=1 Tax=Adhaeribacter pallidiroseus TaxID=2072847 RepID=A0A369QFH3_9BACT|nr:deoxyribodipyrimidine photo-lyase [Adhaeribacter pallidiroseus]RDC61976.1 Deoxyribodipyrimidine photo-lyase [Adhaeribacter pallidiroseus]
MLSTTPVAIFWFRRDLRLPDNAGLYHALKGGTPVLPLFIFDTDILDKLPDTHDPRVQFIHDTITELARSLQQAGSGLLVKKGQPRAVFADLMQNLKIAAVYTNHDYEPYAEQRDTEIRNLLAAENISFHTFKDQVIFEKNEVVKPDGKPYTVFTPYKKRWFLTLNNFYVQSYPTEQYFKNLVGTAPFPLPTLAEIGFKPTSIRFPGKIAPEAIIKTYDQTRDYPAQSGTSRLSLHLRFGTISIRETVRLAQRLNSTWLNELIWRDFYHMILYHFPQVAIQAFKPAYNHIPWRNNEDEFAHWCAGTTGYPLVDAGMRELNATGFMHNRVRMVVASFLCKHLLIDWRWGEAYFAGKLLDYDLAANNGGWQWAAGSGCDAAPYFRVFNPSAQIQKFDRQKLYVQHWVPEWESSNYNKPLVNHELARKRAINTYKEALATFKNNQ